MPSELKTIRLIKSGIILIKSGKRAASDSVSIAKTVILRNYVHPSQAVGNPSAEKPKTYLNNRNRKTTSLVTEKKENSPCRVIHILQKSLNMVISVISSCHFIENGKEIKCTKMYDARQCKAIFFSLLRPIDVETSSGAPNN